MSKYVELFVQQGSFGFIAVSHEDANPHFSNRPFKVIDKAALAELERKLAESQKACDEFAKKFAQYHDAFIKQQTVIEKLKEHVEKLVDRLAVTGLKKEQYLKALDKELAKLEKGDK